MPTLSQSLELSARLLKALKAAKESGISEGLRIPELAKEQWQTALSEAKQAQTDLINATFISSASSPEEQDYASFFVRFEFLIKDTFTSILDQQAFASLPPKTQKIIEDGYAEFKALKEKHEKALKKLQEKL